MFTLRCYMGQTRWQHYKKHHPDTKLTLKEFRMVYRLGFKDGKKARKISRKWRQ